MKYCALAACLLLTATDPAAAINSNSGTTGFNFLKIGVGARSAALGGAYAAVAQPSARVTRSIRMRTGSDGPGSLPPTS